MANRWTTNKDGQQVEISPQEALKEIDDHARQRELAGWYAIRWPDHDPDAATERFQAHGCSKIMMGRVCFGFVTRGVSGW
jgi:hypothetical protein